MCEIVELVNEFSKSGSTTVFQLVKTFEDMIKHSDCKRTAKVILDYLLVIANALYEYEKENYNNALTIFEQ